MIEALKQEITDYINATETNLMVSVANIHDDDAINTPTDTMGVFRRYVAGYIVPEVYKTLTIQFGFRNDSIVIVVGYGVLTVDSKPNLRDRSAHGIIIGSPAVAHKVHVKEEHEMELYLYQGNPESVMAWVACHARSWLL